MKILILIISLFFINTVAAKTVTMTDWKDFKNFKAIQNVNKIMYQIEDKQVEFKLSGQITDTKKVEKVTIKGKKVQIIPIIKMDKYPVSEKALPSSNKDADSFLGLMSLDGDKEPYYIIYNPKTKNFGVFAGEVPVSDNEKKMSNLFLRNLDKKVFWISIRYMYK